MNERAGPEPTHPFVCWKYDRTCNKIERSKVRESSLIRKVLFKGTLSLLCRNLVRFAQFLNIMKRPIRVLIAKIGLDGHDRGAKVIASALKDAGMEVIYTGLRQTPDMVVQTALQEDVDAIGVSILSGAHMTVFPALIDLLKAHDLQHILLTGGGIIPEDDRKKLKEMGVDELFTPGTPTSDIAQYIQQKVKF
jgi:methylmalonyl-CoA mutase C-terminal domain/subunit